MVRLTVAALAACFLAHTVEAKTKKVAPSAAPKPAAASQQDCSALPGTWTGFVGNNALFDLYELEFRGGAYPADSFTSVYVSSSPGWSLGQGQLSADNSSAVITFDTGVTLHGNVSDGCTTIMWDNDSSWRKTTAGPKKVHMVFMNHLDVGYNGIPGVGYINNILNIYFATYFPRAVAMAQAMHALNTTDRFVYTTHTWLVDLYIHCPANFTFSSVTLVCPSPADVQAMKDAIAAGDISFHAAPFNIQYGGAYSQDMLDAIFRQPARIADEVGIPRPKVASLRDVPGAPRSIIPGLVRNGIEVLSIGDNGYAPKPQINTPTVWREPATNTSIVLLMTGQGVGYPNNAGPTPVSPGGLAADTCVSHPSSAAVLCWAFRTDNSGPPESVSEILGYFDMARWQWPGATVIGSTFEAWWSEFKVDALPVLPVTTQEMGETWLTGFAADPVKMATYRAAAAAYSTCLAAGQCDPINDARIVQFLFYLQKMPEHTWGLPTINDDSNYTNAQFHAARASGEATYVESESSWQEQRQFAQYALSALADHPLAAQITSAWAALVPSLPNTNGFTAGGNGPWTVSTPAGSVTLALDASTGAISSLTLPGAPGPIADAQHLMGRLVYQTVNDTEIDEQHITTEDGFGCCCCYGWGSMQKVANPISSRTPASLVQAWQSQTGTLTAPFTVLARVSIPADFHINYGAPADAWLNYTVQADGTLSITLTLLNKTSTRLGEAIYLDFSTPPASDGQSLWLADVLGHYVDPLDVVTRGSQRQHGVGAGVAYLSSATGAGVAVDTIDSPVVSPWTALNATSTMIVPYYPLAGPVLGMSSVVFANIYNTNFPLYSVDSAWQTRYVVRVVQGSGESARLAKAAAASSRTSAD